MKQQVNTSWLSIRLGAAFLLLLVSVPQLVLAQEDGDTLRIVRDSMVPMPGGVLESSPIYLFPERTEISPLHSSGPSYSLPEFSLKEEIRLPYQVNPSLNFRGDYSTDGILKQFEHGALFGSGAQTTLPGIGRFNDASLGYQHVFNEKLAMQFSFNAMKINMARITGQAFSASGALFYHPSDRVTFKVFGSYDIGNSYGMSTNVYGASMSVDMSERFGVEMGVQRYYDGMRGRWETVPIVAPYYNFDKFTLGLDVGGLLYEILRTAVFDRRDAGSGPTIAPPRLSLPIR